MEYHNKLKELRTTNGLYQSWERGLTQPDIFNLIKLSTVYNCSVDYIIGNESEDGRIMITNGLSEDENALINIVKQLSIKDKSILYDMAMIMLKAKNAK